MWVFVFRGPPRRPPPQVQEQVKSLNQSLRLGHLLCRSRSPDFLLNIIQRQVTVIISTVQDQTSLHRSGQNILFRSFCVGPLTDF